MQESKKDSIRTLATKVAFSATMLATPVTWMAKTTNGFTQVPKKAGNTVYNAPLSDSMRRAGTYKIKERFVDVIAGFKTRNEKTELQLTKAELEYAKEKYKDLEMLGESRTSSGFYGALFRDKVTNETLLNFAGADMPAEIGKMVADLDDMAFEGTGGAVSQTKDAIAFATQAEALAIKKTGKGVTHFTGYSLGAYNGYFVAGMGILKEADHFFYDGPGINTTTVSTCAEYSGLSEAQVEKNFNSLGRCYDFTSTHNLVNTMGGVHPGIALTIDNEPIGSLVNHFVPKKHSYNSERVREMGAVETLVDRTNDEDSKSPSILIGIFLALATLPWVPNLTRALNKNSQSQNASADNQIPAYVGTTR